MTHNLGAISLGELTLYRAAVRRARDDLAEAEQRRRAAIAAAVRDGHPHVATAEAAGVSEATVYRIARASRDNAR